MKKITALSYLQLPDELWREKDIGALMWYLLLHADENGEIDITQRALAGLLDISTRKLRKIMEWLSAKRILKQEPKRKLTHLTVLINSELQHFPKQQTKRILKQEPKRKNIDSELLIPETVSTDEINFDHLVSFFNDSVKTTAISQIRGLDARRKKMVISIYKEYGKEAIMLAINKAVESDFCNGTETKWKCSFDWIFNKSNFLKIIEGNYDNRSNQTQYRTSGQGSKGDRSPASLADAVLARLGNRKSQ